MKLVNETVALVSLVALIILTFTETSWFLVTTEVSRFGKQALLTMITLQLVVARKLFLGDRCFYFGNVIVVCVIL